VKFSLRSRCQLSVGARVLVCVSGGAASTCLAHLMSEACDTAAPEAAKHKMYFAFQTAFVDEGAVLLGTDEEHAAFTEQVKRLYAPLPQKLLVVPLEHVMALGTDREEVTFASLVLQPGEVAAALPPPSNIPPDVSAANRAALQRLFSSLKDMSDKGDLLVLLRLRLLAHVARLRGLAQLVFASDATSTAVSCFADTAKGRGAHVALDVLGREGSRFQVECAYPMRDVSSKLVGLYNHYQRLSPVHRPYFLPLHKSAVATAGGLNKLSHDFLCMLDAQFSSSVSNVVSTVGKLALPLEYSLAGVAAPSEGGAATAEARCAHGPPVRPGSHCSLCGRARVAAEADTARTAQAAVAASRLTQSAANAAVLASVSSCYGCAALMRELSDASALPAFVLAGQAGDHRAPVAEGEEWRSTYPPPFNAVIPPEELRAQNARLRADRAASKAAARAREAAAAADAGDEDDALDAAAMGEFADGAEAPIADAGAPAQLHLQSRDDMKASIGEFLL